MLLTFSSDYSLHDKFSIYKNSGYLSFLVDFTNVDCFSIKYVISLFKETIPLDPPLSSCENLDAFADSFFGGISSLEKEKICISLVQLNKCKKSNGYVLTMFLEILKDNIMILENEGKEVVVLIS